MSGGGMIPDGFERGACKWGCRASIFWAKILDPVTLQAQRNRDGSARRVPLNRETNAAGTWKYESAAHRGVRWIAGGELVPVDQRWQGHHVTCPHAQTRRTRRVPPRAVPPRAAQAAPEPDPRLF
jgi:hypothetical protein